MGAPRYSDAFCAEYCRFLRCISHLKHAIEEVSEDPRIMSPPDLGSLEAEIMSFEEFGADALKVFRAIYAEASNQVSVRYDDRQRTCRHLQEKIGRALTGILEAGMGKGKLQTEANKG